MDVTMECRDTGLTALPEYVEPSITKYRLSGNRLNHTLSVRSFEGLHRLTLLDLSANDIMELPNGRPFATLWQLRVLVLRKNGISRLRKELFYGLANVRVLDLAENYIEIVEERAFTGLSSLPQLDLSRQLISHLPAASFLGLRSLLSLNLSGNPLQYFDVDTFLGLPQLVTLDLSSSVHWNAVRFTGEAFRHLPALTHLYTSDARLCCSIGGKVPHCYPKLDHFSSCSDLMSNRILRTSIWLMGTIAVVANAVVIVWRLPGVRRSRIHAFLIINLAVGDIIMGVYLLIIAGADLHYRGTYIFYYDVWKSSGWCKAAGVFSTVSSELSIFTLLLITLDRLLTILLPFHIDLRLSYASARIAVLLLWISVWTIALIPLLPLPYFQNFYGRSGVCLALHITPDRSPGWEYAVFIFLGLNMLACVLIILSYAGMYGVALRTHRAVEPSPQKSRQEARLARRMVLIVLTSLACYLPLSIMSLLALAGVSMPEEVYSWVAVFMLPVNAALNPLLYTMSTRPFKRHIQTSITDRAAHLRESLLASMSSSSRRRRSSASTTSGSGQAKNKRALSLKREDVLPEE
ncbi:hypothetical protein RvY_12079-2 [Ramazzottius varieornatus]|uniref:G-protein coupled receptors family 1 profile domain-containing protein n=1 Tax=Ramazzottius varieornatus TaxID=947166 RepID=A0A1D1VI94_RAMVA|nr:hypothetical protein RvY_12079-2 [Ramazzottius varieornatus]